MIIINQTPLTEDEKTFYLISRAAGFTVEEYLQMIGRIAHD